MRLSLKVGIGGSVLIIAVCLFALIGIYVRHHSLALTETICVQIAHWAKASSLAVGAYPQPSLPASITLPKGSLVNLVVTSGGDVVVLLKTNIGWKENYNGFLYSTRPLTSADMTTDCYGRQVITIDGIDNNHPVIKNRINAEFMEVYFDLG
jgi:hypothetical protein